VTAINQMLPLPVATATGHHAVSDKWYPGGTCSSFVHCRLRLLQCFIGRRSR